MHAMQAKRTGTGPDPIPVSAPVPFHWQVVHRQYRYEHRYKYRAKKVSICLSAILSCLYELALIFGRTYIIMSMIIID